MMLQQLRVNVVEIADDPFETIILVNGSGQPSQSLVTRFTDDATQPLTPHLPRQSDHSLMT